MIACGPRIDLNVIFYRNRLLIRNLNGVFFSRLRRFDRFGRLLICGLAILLSGCDFEDKPLTEAQRKEACVSSYMERFYISIVEGPETDDFFSVVKNENTYFSVVTAGSFDARAVLYLLPVLPSPSQVSRVSDQEFEELGNFYNQPEDQREELGAELADSETLGVFNELSEVVTGQLDMSKQRVNQKLCKLSYVVGEDQRREDKHAVIGLREICELEAPLSAKFIVPDEKEFYKKEFRDQLNQMMESISLRPVPLWRSNWATGDSGACLLYSFSKRIET